MTTFLLTLVLMLSITLAMALGVILQNKPIKGSCGGIAALGLDTECEICGGDPEKCEESSTAESVQPSADSAALLAYYAFKEKRP